MSCIHRIGWSSVSSQRRSRLAPGGNFFCLPWGSGLLNVYLERRPRGGAYWYAYHTREGRTRKRYLGRTETLSLARLEETAQALWREALQRPAGVRPGDAGALRQAHSAALADALVERERLLSALDGALATPLTLLSAPAGLGKTTLLSAWASRHQAQVAWLSLDELDNSPTRFWVSLIAALRRCGEVCTAAGGNSGGAAPIAPAAAAFLYPYGSAPGTGKPRSASCPHRAHCG